MKETSLYIHIPYCASKCIYCDFFSGGAVHADWERLRDALTKELEKRRDELETFPDTLYIGGGTPSLMPSGVFASLVAGINKIANPAGVWKEFTVEVNPDDVTVEKCKAWQSAGVTRISIGVQSLNDGELQAIRRRHDSATALRAYSLIRDYFSNVSIDLMFGIPGQTPDSWKETVAAAVKMRPEHLSAYSLMLEEGTPLTALCNRGRIELPGEEECDVMWNQLTEELKNAGYEQYEISNYSLQGFRSVHNSRYWSGNPYLGLGPSAHSYDGYNIRRFNPADLRGYLDYYNAPESIAGASGAFYNEEILNEEERIEEELLTRMRVKEGIDLKRFRDKFGDSCLQRLLHNAAPLSDAGLVKIDSGSLSLTAKGVMTSNQIILSLSC